MAGQPPKSNELHLIRPHEFRHATAMPVHPSVHSRCKIPNLPTRGKQSRSYLNGHMPNPCKNLKSHHQLVIAQTYAILIP